MATALVLTPPGFDSTALGVPRGAFDAHAVAALTTMIITTAAVPRRDHLIRSLSAKTPTDYLTARL